MHRLRLRLIETFNLTLGIYCQNELGLLEMLRQLVQRGALNMYSIHILR